MKDFFENDKKEMSDETSDEEKKEENLSRGMGRLISFGPLGLCNKGPIALIGKLDAWLKPYEEFYPYSLCKASIFGRMISMYIV